MKIPVVWLSYRQPRIINRGYWDQALLEEILSRLLWRPAAALEYEHYDDFSSVGDGAVVVLPAQHHASPDDLDRLNEQLRPLDWVLLILAGDECSLFPWRELEHPNLRLWLMTPRASLHRDCPATFIGEGWQPGTRAALREMDTLHKPLDWFFAGQITHTRRQQAAHAMRELEQLGEIVETPGFTQGLNQIEYLYRLARSKLAPAPSGPCTPDSFRMYEALEAGCLPLIDAVCPGNPDDGAFWPLVYGEAPPLPIVWEWADLSRTVDRALADWPDNVNRASAWWQQQKRRLAYQLDDDVRALKKTEPVCSDVDDQTTVIVTTSPIPTHPDTAIIDETIESARRQLPNSEILVAIDGVRTEQRHRSADYAEYTRRLLRRTNLDWFNVLPLLADRHLHQANLMRWALEYVRTPLVLFVEHDTPIIGDIEWTQLAQAIQTHDADLIRLHHEVSILEPHQHLMPDGAERRIMRGAPMMRTVQWSQRPHLASTDWYRTLIGTYFGQESRTMVEDTMYGVVDHAWREHGEAGWQQWRLWIYAPEGNMQRSIHLDGRASDPKYGCVYAYDGDVPEGAPYPTAARFE